MSTKFFNISILRLNDEVVRTSAEFPSNGYLYFDRNEPDGFKSVSRTSLQSEMNEITYGGPGAEDKFFIKSGSGVVVFNIDTINDIITHHVNSTIFKSPFQPHRSTVMDYTTMSNEIQFFIPNVGETASVLGAKISMGPNEGDDTGDLTIMATRDIILSPGRNLVYGDITFDAMKIVDTVFIQYGAETGSGLVGNSHVVINRAIADLTDGGTIMLGACPSGQEYDITGSIAISTKKITMIGTGDVTLDFGASGTIALTSTGDFTLERVKVRAVADSLKVIDLGSARTGNLYLNDVDFSTTAGITTTGSKFITATSAGIIPEIWITRCSFEDSLAGANDWLIDLAAADVQSLQLSYCRIDSSGTQNARLAGSKNIFITSTEMSGGVVRFEDSLDRIYIVNSLLPTIESHADNVSGTTQTFHLNNSTIGAASGFAIQSSGADTGGTHNLYIYADGCTFLFSAQTFNFPKEATQTRNVYIQVTDPLVDVTAASATSNSSFDGDNFIEWPRKSRLLGSLPAANVMVNTLVLTTDYGFVRNTGTLSTSIWDVQSSSASSMVVGNMLAADTVFIEYTAGDGTAYAGGNEKVFQRAITGLPDGGMIVVGDGTYTFGATVSIPAKNFTFVGTAGATIAHSTAKLFDQVGAADTAFEDLSITLADNDATDIFYTSSTAVNTFRMTRCKLTTVTTANASAIGITTSAQKIILEGCTFTASGSTGYTSNAVVDIATSAIVNINNCTFTGESTFLNRYLLHILCADELNEISGCTFDNGYISARDTTGTVTVTHSNFNDILLIAADFDLTYVFESCNFMVTSAPAAQAIVHYEASTSNTLLGLSFRNCSIAQTNTVQYTGDAAQSRAIVLTYLNNDADPKFLIDGTTGNVTAGTGNLIEYPKTVRILSALPTDAATVPSDAIALTTDYGTVRWNGSAWTQLLNKAATLDVTTTFSLGGTTVTATAAELNYNDITTLGTVEASKTVTADASSNVSGINSLSVTSLTLGGTAITSTAAELNILDGVTATAAELNYNDITTLGTVEASKTVTTDASSNVSGINSLSVTSLTLGGTAITSTAAELNILDGVTATASELNILDGVTATAAELNYNDITTLGTAEASKTVTADASSNVSGINSLSVTSLTLGGTAITSTAAELNILDGVTATAAELNYNDITTLGTVEASKTVTADASSNVSGINSLSVTSLTLGGTAITSTAAELNILDGVTATASELNILDGVTATAAELNYNDITTLGTAEASKTVTADASSNVSGINSLSVTSLTLGGTAITSTAAELNILDGVTATAAELNYNDITTLGTAEASKTVTADASSNVSGINSLSVTSLTLGGTAITSTAAELNILDGVTATAAELNYNDIALLGTAEASKTVTTDVNNDINGLNTINSITAKLADTIYIMHGTEAGVSTKYTGNTEAVINRAIADLPSDGGLIILGAGTYTLSTATDISIDRSVKIIGVGSIDGTNSTHITTSGTTTTHVFDFPASSSHSLILEDIYMDIASNATATAMTFFTANSSATPRITLVRCFVGVTSGVTVDSASLFDLTNAGAGTRVNITDCIFDSSATTQTNFDQFIPPDNSVLRLTGTSFIGLNAASHNLTSNNTISIYAVGCTYTDVVEPNNSTYKNDETFNTLTIQNLYMGGQLFSLDGLPSSGSKDAAFVQKFIPKTLKRINVYSAVGASPPMGSAGTPVAPWTSSDRLKYYGAYISTFSGNSTAKNWIAYNFKSQPKGRYILSFQIRHSNLGGRFITQYLSNDGETTIEQVYDSYYAQCKEGEYPINTVEIVFNHSSGGDMIIKWSNLDKIASSGGFNTFLYGQVVLSVVSI